MHLTLKDLEFCFKEAKERNYNYIAVKVTVPGCDKEEIIVNPLSNFDCKLEYYKKAYNEDLTLKTFNQIKITGFECAKHFNELGTILIHS